MKIFDDILVKIIIFIILVLIICVIFYLRKKDLKIDYSKKEIKYFIFEEFGVMKLVIPYYIWQLGKRKYIENNFKDMIELEGKKYLVTSPVWRNKYTVPDQIKTEIPLYFLCDYYRVNIEFKEEIKNNYENFQVIGNNNTVINNSFNKEFNKIINDINNLISKEEIEEIYKKLLKSFIDKLEKGKVDEKSKKSTLETLNEMIKKYSSYAELASNIIELINKML
ncbi:hypothetical protein KST23_03560 [Fusobacterium nucleatum]|uniref:hypothetical protein n=1 Tax=Fusobacterium nucleatum TaxID=851 RepID=UPI003D058BB6